MGPYPSHMRSRLRGALRMMLSTRKSNCGRLVRFDLCVSEHGDAHTSAASEAEETTARFSLALNDPKLPHVCNPPTRREKIQPRGGQA